MTSIEQQNGTQPTASPNRDERSLYVSLSFGGDPAEARIIARNGQRIEGWETGPALGDALRALERDGWVMRAGQLSRADETLLPQPILVLGRRGAEHTLSIPR